jgi:hypothetical protein
MSTRAARDAQITFQGLPIDAKLKSMLKEGLEMKIKTLQSEVDALSMYARNTKTDLDSVLERVDKVEDTLSDTTYKIFRQLWNLENQIKRLSK